MLIMIFSLQVLIQKHSLPPGLESSISRLRDRMMYVYETFLLAKSMLTQTSPPGQGKETPCPPRGSYARGGPASRCRDRWTPGSW
jgi:hypothetical protein